MIDLYQRSIEIILNNQSKSGAYIASPNFPTYQYCWFRDASFVAYAMDLAGESRSAAKFHDWAARVIINRSALVERAISGEHTGLIPAAEDQLHTRYTLEGEDGTREEWPNFQLDGLGTWLWSLNEHVGITGLAPDEDWLKAGKLVTRYLEALWKTPCFDCWEEFPEDIHLHTLASIYGGLKAFSRLDGIDRSKVLSDMRAFVEHNGVKNGHFIKNIGSDTVDASLLGLAIPYKMLDSSDQRFKATLEWLETLLVRGGGVHRYQADTYYGGGEWILLAGWMGWVYTRCGKTERAGQLLEWIESHSDEQGNLPEQVPATLNDPDYYQPWVDRWGSIASPLLWSHAKYIILKKELQAVEEHLADLRK
jgi:GH15 family glucan-1,4-alpha-glucosidase